VPATFNTHINLIKFSIKVVLLFFCFYPIICIISTHLLLKTHDINIYQSITDVVKLLYTSNKIYLLSSVISVSLGTSLVFIEMNTKIPFRKILSFIVLITLFIPSNVLIRAFIDFLLYLNIFSSSKEIYTEFIFQIIYSPIGMAIFLAINYSPIAIALLRKKSENLQNELIVADTLQVSLWVV